MKPCSNNHMIVPAELCVYSLRERKVGELMIYLLLKYRCDGFFSNMRGVASHIASELALSVPTVRKHMRELIRKKWITVNSKREVYHVKGFVQLHKKLGFRSNKAVLFRIQDFGRFKAFLIGASITYLMNKKRRTDRASVLYKPRSTTMKALSPSSYFLPNVYLAKVLSVSKSTACAYKHLAEKAGYIKTFPNFIWLPIQLNQCDLFKKYSGHNPVTIRKVNGKVCVQESDYISSSISMRKKRTLKPKH